MKLCNDCKHSQDTEFEFGKCNAPKNIIIDITNGSKKRKWTYCSVHRSMFWLGALLTGTCGRSGRWFKLKEIKDGTS